jgi:predicted RNase H-like HicB family nuclease
MNKDKKQFKVIIEHGNDGYFVASVPALPGCYTQAKTLGQLNKRVREAIELCLEVIQNDPQYRQRVKEFSSEPVFVGLETVTL